jgi:nucleotide-binding universal stress UspA family protein
MVIPLCRQVGINMYEKILVPLDGSKAAEMVIPYAEEIVAKLGSQMILVSVCESIPDDTEQLHRTYLERVTEQIQQQLKDWKPQKETQVHSKVLMGKPADEILRYADESDIGLIAMTSHGSSVHDPWVLGNIAAKVLRATGRPLLLVRTATSEAALEEKRLVKRILVPLDGSELGAGAIPYTETLGQALGAELVLFQAFEPITSWAGYGGGYVPYQVPEALEKSAIAYLDNIGKPLKEKRLKVSSAVALGSPAQRIIDYAETNAIDLIAMSTHGRTGINRWVFGSVTDKVLHAGDVAVLVVRATKA